MVPEAGVSLTEVEAPAAQNVRSKGEPPRANDEGRWQKCSQGKSGMDTEGESAFWGRRQVQHR